TGAVTGSVTGSVAVAAVAVAVGGTGMLGSCGCACRQQGEREQKEGSFHQGLFGGPTGSDIAFVCKRSRTREACLPRLAYRKTSTGIPTVRSSIAVVLPRMNCRMRECP